MSTETKPKLYFVNAVVDFLLIGGLSLFILAGIWLAGYGASFQLPTTSAGEGHWIVTVSLSLLWVINYPHFAASTYRLYQNRDHLRQYPMTAYVIPWVIVGLMLASFFSPLVIAPLFVKVFLIWSPYHYSGQTLGITLIYLRRAGFRLSRLERLSRSTFIYGTFISTAIRAEFGSGLLEFFGIPFPRFGLPEWGRETFGSPILQLIPLVVMTMGGIAFLAFALRLMIIERRRMPLIVFVPGIAQFAWLVIGYGWPAYQQFVPLFHSLQYLLIAWSMHLKTTMDRRGTRPSYRYVITESGRWSAIIFVGGFLLFSTDYGLPRWLAILFQTSLDFSAGIVLSAIQIHHFFVDGVIWKLKSKSVASPLMVNLDDLVREPVREPAA